MSETDFLIVGGGLAGSILAEVLIGQEKKIFIIDQHRENSSSLVAAGIFNPITGRRVVKSWRADELIPFAIDYYSGLEQKNYFLP